MRYTQYIPLLWCVVFCPSWMIPPPAFAGKLITCASDQNVYNYCRVDTQGRVRLQKQLSGAPCLEGRSWGYDGEGVWVDRGCRAKFAVGRSRSYSSRAPLANKTVECGSNHYGYNYCRVDTEGSVRLEKQLSDTLCVEGRSWGYDHRGIWVDRGCRAKFTVGDPPDYSFRLPGL